MPISLKEKSPKEVKVSVAVSATVCAIILVGTFVASAVQSVPVPLDETPVGFYIGNPPPEKATEQFFGRF